MTDKPSVMNVGDAIIEGLEEAVAWKGGELWLRYSHALMPMSQEKGMPK